MKSLRGTGVALITPFTQDLAVDYESLRKLLHFNLEAGVNYLVVNGTTAESPTLTDTEKIDILTFVKEFTAGKVPVVFGIGGNSTQQVLEIIKQTDFTGVAAILSVSPYYNKPSQQGLYQHYLEIANACPVPVILYNVPGRTASNLTAETTLKLAKHPNIIGTKEASGNLEQCLQIVKYKPAGFMLISGDDMLTVPLISVGAEGVISVLANAFPEKYCQMVQLALDNNFQEATKILLDFVDINPLMYEESNPVGVKAVLEMLGIARPFVRLPLMEASMALKTKLQKLL
ncbi:4-hydroxy-tetrahydrodipicolinate synthase [Adhaeribacter pallidiroseus]|uniref:4-hydroxy-tetrahydrodipicolinate synthase n=1 Tax=Adhaeribacter pallidiroseus TaxID=2072847 RepID=A0A369QSL3_9BACT|nr:4-hydroxy-tetrahydrodipicolinate synthase [Adhaeribacter pallidiroseus]RDC65168.1 4-hydroxy-tetrahydrodipicolinate synthase [Adhaeribacter pallidiroseus]